MAKSITIHKGIDAAIERVFDAFITPDDLLNWYYASEGWTTPHAIIDAEAGGKFNIGFQDPTGENSFDFTGTYIEVKRPTRLAYTLDDGRKVTVDFEPAGENRTRVTWQFEMEGVFPEEAQRKGWSAQLDHLAAYLANHA